MREREVILTMEAVNDVLEITEYIEMAFGKGRADRFQSKIKKEIESLKSIAGVFGKVIHICNVILNLPPPNLILWHIFKALLFV